MVAAVFAATPFLLPDVAERLSVDLGTTGLMSTAQVGSFAVASFLAGRLFRPRRRLHYGSLALVGLATLASAIAPNFAFLLGTRVIAGLGLGTLTWIAWADATRFARGIGEVAAIAPLTATLGSPPLGWLTQHGGYPWVFTALSILALAATLLPVDFGELPRVGRSVSSSHSNRVLLAALLALSLGGSSVFVFTGAAAQQIHGLSPLALSWALSINALTGVAATRSNAKLGRAGLWMMGTAVAAIVVGTVSSATLFFLAMALWGYAFWMGIPAVFALLAARSNTPSERVGDAQAAMAVGRVFGPVMGGIALGMGQFALLSWVGAGVMATSALVVGVVERYRLKG